jgi:hypothetical protein
MKLLVTTDMSNEQRTIRVTHLTLLSQETTALSCKQRHQSGTLVSSIEMVIPLVITSLCLHRWRWIFCLKSSPSCISGEVCLLLNNYLETFHDELSKADRFCDFFVGKISTIRDNLALRIIHPVTTVIP